MGGIRYVFWRFILSGALARRARGNRCEAAYYFIINHNRQYEKIQLDGRYINVLNGEHLNEEFEIGKIMYWF